MFWVRSNTDARTTDAEKEAIENRCQPPRLTQAVPRQHQLPTAAVAPLEPGPQPLGDAGGRRVLGARLGLDSTGRRSSRTRGGSGSSGSSGSSDGPVRAQQQVVQQSEVVQVVPDCLGAAEDALVGVPGRFVIGLVLVKCAE